MQVVSWCEQSLLSDSDKSGFPPYTPRNELLSESDKSFDSHNTRKTRADELVKHLRPIFEERAKEGQIFHGNTAPGRPKTLVQNSGQVKTDKELAKLANVSLF